MAEFPALPLFTDAIMADCAHLSDDEFGRYMRLLIVMWRSPECVIPNDPQWICKRLRVDPLDYHNMVKPLIDEFCTCNAHAMHGQCIMQKRLMKEYNHVKESVEKRRAAAQKRWGIENIEENTMQSISNAYAPTPTPKPIPKVINNINPSVTTARGKAGGDLNKNSNESGEGEVERKIGFPDYDIRRYLNDDDLKMAKVGAPGWSLPMLISVYNAGIHDGTRLPPKAPGRAFPVWCQKYTKGKKP